MVKMGGPDGCINTIERGEMLEVVKTIKGHTRTFYHVRKANGVLVVTDNFRTEQI